MTNIITINNQNVRIRQYHGQRVVTFNDIDLVHGRVKGTARRNFNANKSHFIEGEDFYKIQPNEIRTVGILSPNGGTVVTESGYLMLAKSFTDDLSWDVQRQLVKSYFRGKIVQSYTKPYKYFDKTYNGEPVLTSLDVEYLTGISRNNVDYHARHNLCNGKDYFLLVKGELKRFKIENPKVSRMASSIVIITQSGFTKLCQAYGVKIEQPKCFEVKENQQKSAVHKILDNFKKYYNIERYLLTDNVAEKFDVGKNGLVNGSCMIRRLDNDKYQMFTDGTAPLLEKQFMVAQNLGHILAGTLRKDADPDIDYAQEARTFAMVVMALSLYFDN